MDELLRTQAKDAENQKLHDDKDKQIEMLRKQLHESLMSNQQQAVVSEIASQASSGYVSAAYHAGLAAAHAEG